MLRVSDGAGRSRLASKGRDAVMKLQDVSPDDGSVVSQGAFSEDAFLGGQLQLRQPTKGYRAGTDAVFLAASIGCPPGAPLNILDVGSGVGTVALCAGRRIDHANITMVERNTEFLQLAKGNAQLNDLSHRCQIVQADVLASAQSHVDAGLRDESFDHVVANPPFHDEASSSVAPDKLKSEAHQMQDVDLESWVKFMVRMAKPRCPITLVHKASALPKILRAMEKRCGGILVLPLVSKSRASAHRVIVRGLKARRSEFRLLSPFVVHQDDGRFTSQAEDILRRGGALDLSTRLG